MSEEVSRRFQQEDLIFIKEIESLMLNTADGNSSVCIPDSIGNFLKDDFGLYRLKVQHNMIPDLIATAFDNSVKKVTNIRAISSAMLESCEFTNYFYFSSHGRAFFLHLKKN